MIRPADANETAVAWRVAVEHHDGPGRARAHAGRSCRSSIAKVRVGRGRGKGAYVLADPAGGAAPQVVLLSSGSEVQLILQAQEELAEQGVPARTVSMPSMELFARQTNEYQASVLPPGVPRVAIEAAHPMSWYKWVGLEVAR